MTLKFSDRPVLHYGRQPSPDSDWRERFFAKRAADCYRTGARRPAGLGIRAEQCRLSRGSLPRKLANAKRGARQSYRHNSPRNDRRSDLQSCGMGEQLMVTPPQRANGRKRATRFHAMSRRIPTAVLKQLAAMHLPKDRRVYTTRLRELLPSAL